MLLLLAFAALGAGADPPFITLEPSIALVSTFAQRDVAQSAVRRANARIEGDGRTLDLECGNYTTHGTPCFRGTRVSFYNLLDYLAGGYSLDEFLSGIPTVSLEQAVRGLAGPADLAAAVSYTEDVMDTDIRIVSNEAGEATAVIVPIALGKEIASEWETAYLLKSDTMRQRLLTALKRESGVPLEDAVAKLGLQGRLSLAPLPSRIWHGGLNTIAAGPSGSSG